MRAALIDLASSGWIGSQQPSARAPATCSRATPLHSKRGAPPGHPAEAGHPDGPADKPGRRSRPGLPAGSLTLDQPKLAECQAPVRTGALLLTDSAATVSRRAAQLYRSQREDSNLALLVSFLMSASPSGEARPLTGTQESVLFRTGLGGLRPPRMGGQLCEFPPAKQIRNFSPPKRRKRISRLTVTHTVGNAGRSPTDNKGGLERQRGELYQQSRRARPPAARRDARAAKGTLFGLPCRPARSSSPLALDRLTPSTPPPPLRLLLRLELASATRLRTWPDLASLISPSL